MILIRCSDTTHLDNIYSELLSIYRKDEASLQALLAFAATQQNVPQGQNMFVASRAEASTLQILRDRLAQARGPQRPGTLLAVAILAHLEEQRGNSRASRIHWQATKDMLQERGGLDSLNESRPLQAQLLRLDTTIATTAESSLDRPYTTSQHGSLPLANTPQAQQGTSDQILPDETTRSEAQHILDLGEEFLAFFHDIRTALQTSPRRFATFPISPVIISIVNKPLPTDPTGPSHRLLDCTKMAILLFLAAAKLDHQNSQPATGTSLTSLSHEVQLRSSHDVVGIGELLYVMFLNSNQRARLVSRLMSVARKLFSGSWQLAYQILRAYTGFLDNAEAAFSREYAAQWDTDVIRREINGGLYPLLSSLREGAGAGR